MVIQKTAVYKILAIVLALSLFLGSSERVAAADLPVNGEVNNFKYSFANTATKYHPAVNNTYNFSIPVYICIAKSGSSFKVLAISWEEFTCDFFNVYSATYNGKTYYYGGPSGTSSGHSWSLPCNDCDSNDSMNSLINSFKNYFLSDDFDDLIFEPNFESEFTDPLFQLNNFQASIEDGNLVMKWEPFTMLPYRAMENIYIHYQFKQRPEGSAAAANNHRNYLQYDGYSKISDYGLTIPLADLNISEGYMLSSVNAVPFLYLEDDLKNATSRGNSSFVYFDADGISSSPIIVAPDIEVDISEEDREQNLFYSIQNFFSGFFRNLQNTIKTAVVPSGDDVLALLQEMNDWFSERFGFIWYPFDLAIDIVGAFALGEPDSKITVPALTLNMLGGIKLWDEFQVNLDPIGFMQYVRFFTSAIMCCGTVSLAIRKWDEWIGGEH